MSALGFRSLLIGFLFTSCTPSPQVQTLSGFTQGTTYRVRFWTTQNVDASALKHAIDVELVRLDKLLSNYRPDSTIEQFNASDHLGPVNVGREIVRLIRRARQVSEATEGCYDLTIKPMIDLWGFNGDTVTPPGDAELEKTLALTGFEHLDASDDDTVSKPFPALRVDLSSIAQGYSVGRIAALLEDRGIDNYLVEIGGELQARGAKPRGEFWLVGVEQPLPGGRKLQKVLSIRRTAPLSIATSGTYRHFLDRDGKRYSHVVDARTGRPVVHNTVSVTVLHTDPATADAWSTALLCLGRERGLRVADRSGVAALFIDSIAGALEESTSRAWKDIHLADLP
jgi:thiamine biosynthesis lipoprotein